MHRLFRNHPTERLRVLARYVPTIGDGLAGVPYRRLLIPWHRFEASRFHRFKRSLRACHLVPPAPMGSVDRLLEGFTPEVVFSVMQHAAYYDTAHRFARLRHLPLVAAIHDANDEFEPVYSWAQGPARQRDGDFYRYASRRLCISPEMEQLCAGLYGVAGSVLYPNRSEDLQPRPFTLADRLRRPGTLTIGFVGNLNYGYGEALCQLLPVIRRARIRLVLYSRPPGGAAAPLALATDCCEYRGFVPSSEAWAGIKSDCDISWLPYPNPAGRMERLYRYHFPSKLPEYLALGMPVLVTGPEYATGVRWARANADSVVCSTSSDGDEVAALFGRLRTDAAWRRQLAERGWRAGQRDFAPKAILEEFLGHLVSAVAQTRA